MMEGEKKEKKKKQLQTNRIPSAFSSKMKLTSKYKIRVYV